MIKHPLSVGTHVSAVTRTCACAGGKTKIVEGKILKVITNHSGIWYYLDVGTTVKADTIQKIV